MAIHFRSLTPEDQDQLWHWLHVALWDPPPGGLRPIEVLTVHPENPARFMYARCGFREVERRRGYVLMVHTAA